MRARLETVFEARAGEVTGPSGSGKTTALNTWASSTTVLETGDGDVAGGAILGGGVGLVVGLFAPPLLAATAIGAAIGAVLGHFTKKHEEKELGVDLDEYLPPDSSAVVVVVDDMYLDRVEGALIKSAKKISKAIDKDDYDNLEKAVREGQKRIGDAIDS